MRPIVALNFALGSLIACAPKEAAPNPKLAPAEYSLNVPGGKIWYKVSGTGKGLPAVLVHGGPGFSSVYMKSLEEIGVDRPIIRYDQLGSGKSGTMTDTLMMTIPHFVAELDSLRSSLGLEKWHVVGHSWGAMLALEYYRVHPDRVASLTLASTVIDIPAYEARAKSLLKTLPDSIQRIVAKAEAAKKYDSPEYQTAIGAFYSQYVFRHPVQADLDTVFATANQAIYMYMQGPSEFTITGTLKKYNVVDVLPTIKVPTLFTVGEFDEVGPELIKGYSAKVPSAKYVMFPGSAHISEWDAKDAMNAAVGGFLREVDSGGK